MSYKEYNILRAGYERIKNDGWWRGPYAGLPKAFLPQPGRLNGDCWCLVTSLGYAYEPIMVVRKALRIPDLKPGVHEQIWDALFMVNDAQPASEIGRQAVLKILEDAMALADAA